MILCIVLSGAPLSAVVNSGAMGRMPALQGHLVQMVCVELHPHECQDPGFRCRTLHCSEMLFTLAVSSFNVTEFFCSYRC